MSLPVPLVERLLLAKALLDRGALLSSESWFGAESLALLALHDAVELALFVVAEHLQAPVTQQEKFKDLVDKVERELQKLPSAPRLSSRVQLLQMSQARAGLKHSGNRPNRSDVQKWAPDTEHLLVDLCSKALSIRFQDLSLASLIRHKRISRLVAIAERKFSESRYFESILFCSKAFTLCGHESDRPRLAQGAGLRLPRASAFPASDPMDARVQRLEEVIDALAQGISMPDLVRFEDVAPKAIMSMAGTFWFASRRSRSESAEDARFCLDFVTRTVLRQQENRLLRSARRFDSSKAVECRVITDGEIVEHPDELEEVIRKVHPTDVVLVVCKNGVRQRERKSDEESGDFVSVIEDGEGGCILESCLEPIAAQGPAESAD